MIQLLIRSLNGHPVKCDRAINNDEFPSTFISFLRISTNNRFALSEVGDESIKCPNSPDFYNFEVWSWIFVAQNIEEKYTSLPLRLDDRFSHQDPKWSSG